MTRAHSPPSRLLELTSTIPKVTIPEAKINLSNLIQKALSGEEVVITENDKPLVKLISILEATIPKKRRIGGAKGIVEFMTEDFDAPLENFKDYEQFA